MNPQPATGQNRQPDVVCLLPGGSADETVNGLSHLFEHLLIKTLFDHPRDAVIAGHTTEDYILLSSSGLEPADYIETLQYMELREDEVERNKKGLIKEILREASNPREEFFRKVWAGTPYEHSPLGTPDAVQSITPSLLDSFRLRLLKKTHYFFTRDNGIEVHEPTQEIPEESTGIHEFTGIKHREMTFRDREFDIYYLGNIIRECDCSIEALYMLERLMQMQNPGKQIQISEKKDKCALILEKGILFPKVDSIGSLWEPARRQIAGDVDSISAEFQERALNQLESRFFYGRRWESRIRRLNTLIPLQITELIRQMK